MGWGGGKRIIRKAKSTCKLIKQVNEESGSAKIYKNWHESLTQFGFLNAMQINASEHISKRSHYLGLSRSYILSFFPFTGKFIYPIEQTTHCYHKIGPLLARLQRGRVRGLNSFVNFFIIYPRRQYILNQARCKGRVIS